MHNLIEAGDPDEKTLKRLSEAAKKSTGEVAAFIESQAMDLVREQLKGKLVEMFSQAKPDLAFKQGDNLYIKDFIYNYEGKTQQQIYDIVLGKIKDYERIYPEYDYKAMENQFNSTGGMEMVFHFIMRK